MKYKRVIINKTRTRRNNRMGKLKVLIGSVLLTLSLVIPLNVFASEPQDDLNEVEVEAFQRMIDEIVEIKTNNPEMNDEEIFALMEQNHPRNTHIKGIADIWNSLTDAEKKLCIRYPFDALKVNTARNIATEQTERKFGYSGLGDRSDAFRHGIWNAEMTVLIGREKAELFATAHEDKDTIGNESDGFSKEAHKQMDLHNNATGRIIGEKHKDATENEMADIIYQEIYSTTTQFTWLHE